MHRGVVSFKEGKNRGHSRKASRLDLSALILRKKIVHANIGSSLQGPYAAATGVSRSHTKQRRKGRGGNLVMTARQGDGRSHDNIVKV